jgi:RNA polymerase sigma-70 factor (ECF subfamily)
MVPEDDSDLLIQRARQGDARAVEELFTRHRDRLRRMVDVRLDSRLRARVDASDVVQEAQLEVFTRLDEYLQNAKMPFYLWLRLEVGKHLMRVHRRHLGTAMRDARRDVSLQGGAVPSSSSDLLAAHLVDRQSSPSHAVSRAERKELLRQALDELDPIDQEIIALRNFEMLDRQETAAVLGITEAAASKRYLRALRRLETILHARPGGTQDL